MEWIINCDRSLAGGELRCGERCGQRDLRAVWACVRDRSVFHLDPILDCTFLFRHVFRRKPDICYYKKQAPVLLQRLFFINVPVTCCIPFRLYQHCFLISLLLIWFSPLLCIVDTFFLHFRVFFYWLSVNSKKKISAGSDHASRNPHPITEPYKLFCLFLCAFQSFCLQPVLLSSHTVFHWCDILTYSFPLPLPSPPVPAWTLTPAVLAS